ncbi:MAG: hypothetical protein LIP77_00990, partial [Planctomycetes bacterium]|nr:hypothetical protein [Planctomycetota bacterium]
TLNRPDPVLRNYAASALLGLAEIADKRDERQRLLRQAGTVVLSGRKPNHYIVSEVYEKLAATAATPQEELAIHQEFIRISRDLPHSRSNLVGSVMMKTVPLLTADDEKIAVLDDVIRLLEKSGEDDGNLVTALVDKAELTTSPAEKVALADRALAVFLAGKGRYFYSTNTVARAILLRAQAQGEAPTTEELLQPWLVLPAKSRNIKLAQALAKSLPDTEATLAAYDTILAFYRGRSNASCRGALRDIESDRALLTHDNEAWDKVWEEAGFVTNSRPSPEEIEKSKKESERRWELLRTVQKTANREAKIALIDKSLADENLDFTFKTDLMMFKADAISDSEEKRALYQDIVERTLSDSSWGRNWSTVRDAYGKLAALLPEDGERLALYDDLIDRFSDSLLSGVDSFLKDIRRDRLAFLPEARRLVELKGLFRQAAAETGYGASKRVGELVQEYLALLATLQPHRDAGEEFFLFLETAENKLDAIRRTLDRTAELFPHERQPLYEAIAERYQGDPDATVGWVADQVRLQAILLIRDADERDRQLDDLLAAWRRTARPLDLVRALRKKANLAASDDDKRALLEEISDRLAEPASAAERRELARSLVDRAGLTPDRTRREELRARAKVILWETDDPLGRLLLDELEGTGDDASR